MGKPLRQKSFRTQQGYTANRRTSQASQRSLWLLGSLWCAMVAGKPQEKSGEGLPGPPKAQLAPQGHPRWALRQPCILTPSSSSSQQQMRAEGTPLPLPATPSGPGSFPPIPRLLILGTKATHGHPPPGGADYLILNPSITAS